MKKLIFVTYDGIQNSVFSGQVIQPLLKRIYNNPELKVYIVSFEKNTLSHDIITKFIPQNKNLVFVNFRRLPVLGKISLYPSVYYLKKFLKQFDNYEIISRGPLAGWVADKALNQNCIKHILQARGLLAEEYEFSHLPGKNIFKHVWHTWRKNFLFKIEKEAYTNKNCTIKPVSSALADYLIETYKADPNKIIIEKDDIPELISQEQKNEWRVLSRKKLNISPMTQIYCYNGAVKAWQCPDLVINYFQTKLEHEQNIFLLILSQDKEEFEKMIARHANIKNYLVLSVKHEDIYKYLCAADYGLIFRKSNHIVNWVSRPVKAMEYKAAGLKIIHNNTVKWLNE
ncbi:MAG: hypothetical protein P4L22_03950 [Candidatus Babeliales bacterium]|nr:hypothetical protein [Candidatus Babeliales bacterium]